MTAGFASHTVPVVRAMVGTAAVILLLTSARLPAATPGARVPPGESAHPAAPPDLDFILEQAQRVQKADTLAWTNYRFRREVVREVLDDEGQVREREDLEFVLTPGLGQFDEELVRADGKEPAPAEVDRHRRLARFSRSFNTMLKGSGGDETPGGYSLGLLLRLSTYRYGGREILDGIPCHRIDFSPQEGAPSESLAVKVTGVMAGSLWITVDGFHLARAEAVTMRPVSFVFLLARVRRLKVSIRSVPVGEDVWLPGRIEMLTEARVLIKSIHKHNLLLYSDFQRVDRPPDTP